MAIRVIPARPTVQTINGNSGGFNQPKLKVGAYCRISTELESQEGSYEAQVRHYTDLINKNPLWEMAGIFADEGITGTQAKKRPGFLRMIEECQAGNISMVSPNRSAVSLEIPWNVYSTSGFSRSGMSRSISNRRISTHWMPRENY